MDRVQKLYDAISAQTLNSSRRLYVITQPFRLQTLSSMPLRRVFTAFVITTVMTLVIAIIACLVHNTRRSAPVRELARTA